MSASHSLLQHAPRHTDKSTAGDATNPGRGDLGLYVPGPGT